MKKNKKKISVILKQLQVMLKETRTHEISDKMAEML
jgi:hypothetical protein